MMELQEEERERPCRRGQLVLLPGAAAANETEDYCNNVVEEIHHQHASAAASRRRTTRSTWSLALLTMVVVCIVMQVLLMGETVVNIPTQLERIAETTMSITFNVTFDSLACVDAQVHMLDAKGNLLFDTRDTIIKTPLHLDGRPILGRNATQTHGNQRGEELKYMTQGEGCNLAGYIKVYRVAGNFHIAMGRPDPANPNRDKHQLEWEDRPNFHLSHTIHSLHLDDQPNGVLDGTRFFVDSSNGTTGFLRYVLTVIPVHREDSRGESNRYIVNQTIFSPLYNTTRKSETASIPNDILPGVFVVWNMNPSSELLQEQRWDMANALRLAFYTVGIFVFALFVDEAFFGARRRLTEHQRTRARMLVIV